MRDERPRDILDRTFRFAVRVVSLCQAPVRRRSPVRRPASVGGIVGGLTLVRGQETRAQQVSAMSILHYVKELVAGCLVVPTGLDWLRSNCQNKIVSACRLFSNTPDKTILQSTRMGNLDHDRRDAASFNAAVLDEVNRSGRWFHARKTRPIWVKTVEHDQTVQTLEGEVQMAAGDLLCRGVGGELWPQKPAAVTKKYSPTDDVDAAGWRKHVPQPDAEGVMAAQVNHPFAVMTSWGRLAGKAGDFVVKNFRDRETELPDDVWIVDQGLSLTWTHGSRGPAVFTEHAAPDWAWGVFVGSEGMLWVDYPQHRLAPEPKFADFVPPEPRLPSSIGHHAEWIAACKTGSPTGCHFGYSGPVAEAVMLGSVAYRCGEPLEWDAAHLRVTNVPEANDLLHREYRDGWTL